MTQVTAGLTYKRALPNYENVTVHCSVTDEPRENETTSQAWDRVYKFCETKINAKISEIDQDLGNS